MTPETTEVAVVGASVAGLVTALGLAREGHEVVVLDTAAAPHLSWSAVHHWAVLPILEQLGVLDDALVAGEATARWGLRVLETGEQLTYDVRELAPDVPMAFNLRLEPPALREVLRAALRHCPGVRLREGLALAAMRQDDAGVDLGLTGADAGWMRARWVVGADGPASAVRRHAGLAFEGTTWEERCVAALVRHDFGADGYPDTTFQIDGRWGAVVERAGRDRWRYLFQESQSRPEEQIGQRLHEVLHAVTGAAPEVLDWTSARMHQRSATAYRAGRVLLVGDAAHLAHPMTGHTSLSGWYDGATLGPVLAHALRSRGDASVTTWAALRRRQFLDHAAPTSLGWRNLLAHIRETSRLEVELAGFRRAIADPVQRREMLLAERDGLRAGLPSGPHF